MRYVPYPDTVAVPNIIVDGPRNDATVLALSHWARSGTPKALAADTSTEIVYRYFDHPEFRVDAEAVSNNHFDEDGLLGMYALLNPAEGERHRNLLIDASKAGDFDVYRSRDAARVAFVIGAWSSSKTSPLPANVFKLPWQQQAAELYTRVFDMLPALLTDIGGFRTLWEDEDSALTRYEALIDSGDVTLEERVDLDLVVVRAPEGVTPNRMAIHSRSDRTRVAIIRGRDFEFYYRYETWVQLASRRPLLRVDLSGLADELTLGEIPPARWTFDDVEDLAPRFYLREGESSLEPEAVLKHIEHHLRTGAVALDPYGD